MTIKTERKRLNELFADFERLATAPEANAAEIWRELESLRARLLNHEKQIPAAGKTAVASLDNFASDSGGAPQRPPGAIIYDADQIGYAYSNDKLEPLQGPPHGLPGINNAITAPITVSGQPIGELQIAPPLGHQWTADERNVANGIAQAASIQIQNLRLLAVAEGSRHEAELATRRFIHEGWDAYLDAVNRSERIGYAYDRASVTPYSAKLNLHGGVRQAVAVMDEEVGALYLQPDPQRVLTDADKELVSAVADQVAQQVENIRLLSEASRARAEADDAIRRLTRGNWESFATDRVGGNPGFIFDSVQITPMNESSWPQDVVLTQPLIVRGEAVGHLSVAGGKRATPEDIQMAASIAAQASIHLETLRLSEELQKRANELEELDRLKSAFLANMSHELRTPLNSILGFSDVILEGLDGALTANMDNDIRLIQKNGKHLLHLINDVLDMAKIESGKMSVDLEKFRLHDILYDVVSLTSTIASEKNLLLIVDEASDRAIEIYADNTRLRQVMINLVNNSIKFTEAGRITLCATPLEGARVLITVKDTGIGIPLDQLETIFQEFTQVDTSTTRKGGGTGLGLPISRRLVNMHGGRLWAESTGISGEGSTFFVELPLEARITVQVEKLDR